eukprot:921757-Prymnesium_polylepis.1
MSTNGAISSLPSDTVNQFLYSGAAATVDANLDCNFPPAPVPPPPPPDPAPFPPVGSSGGPITVEVIIYPDNYPAEISWEVRYPCTVDGGGPFGCSSPSEEIGITGAEGVGRSLLLVRGTPFTFQVFDSYGDGIFAPGGYAVSVGGTVVVSVRDGSCVAAK